MNGSRTCGVAVAVALGVGLAASSALAQSPYRLRLDVDVPLLGLGAAGSAAAFVELPPPACLPTCSPLAINPIDRSVVGNYSETALLASDLVVLTLLAAPLALDFADSGGNGWIEDATVFAETILLTQALTQIVKVAVRRNAPFVYDPRVPDDVRTGSSATRSFFSGHSATAFSAATAYTVTYWLRHPDSPWRWVVLGVSGLVAATASLLKVAAGYHFWTDILVGAVVGVSVGALVPLAHRFVP